VSAVRKVTWLAAPVTSRPLSGDHARAVTAAGWATRCRTTPSERPSYDVMEIIENDAMQRDLKIALAEYAPGAEVIRGEFPNTYIYRSVGVYDRYNASPDYNPSGTLVECADCQSIMLVSSTNDAPDRCAECGSFHVMPLPYLRPRGLHGGLRIAKRRT
jgi:hypothetical protein